MQPEPARTPTAVKPDTVTAMRGLIAQVRAVMPFDQASARVCDGECRSCGQKLLDFMQAELEDWESRLDAGTRPNLGDLDRLGRTARKVYRALEKNDLVPPLDPPAARD
jgi:hypothetical protein